MHRTHKAALFSQTCLSALTGKFTTPLSCQSVADCFSRYTSANEAIVRTKQPFLRRYEGCGPVMLWEGFHNVAFHSGGISIPFHPEPVLAVRITEINWILSAA